MEEKKIPSIKERLAAIEAQHAAILVRLEAIEKHSHNIPMETVNEIAAHTVQVINEQIRTALGQAPAE